MSEPLSIPVADYFNCLCGQQIPSSYWPQLGQVGGFICEGCGRRMVVCSDGFVQPMTGMGMQNVEMHEYLRANPRKTYSVKVVLERNLTKSLRLFIYTTSIGLAKESARPNGGTMTWYPFHLSKRGLKIRLRPPTL